MNRLTWHPFHHPDNPPDAAVPQPEPEASEDPRPDPPALTFSFPIPDAARPEAADRPSRPPLYG